MSIDLYIIGHCVWLNAFVCYAGIWMTGRSYEQEEKTDGSKNRHSEVQIIGAEIFTFADDIYTRSIL